MFPPQVKHGITLINQEACFEAHEALEEAWRSTPAPIQELYQVKMVCGAASPPRTPFFSLYGPVPGWFLANGIALRLPLGG